MKKIVNIVEVDGQDFTALLGEQVTLFCINYIYHGKLSGANQTDLLLEDAYIVYETGAFQDKGFKDAQFIAKEWRVRTSMVESYGVIATK